MPISFFSSEVHKNYGTYFNGTRKQIFNQVKKMFHYKEKLYWTLQSKGLIMEEGNENKGFFTSRIDSVLKSDSQTFFHHSSQPTPLPLNPIQNLNILFGYDEAGESLHNKKQVKTQFDSEFEFRIDSKHDSNSEFFSYFLDHEN